MQNIAIVGTGIAGMGIASFLHRSHKLSIFEKNDYIGGHTHTVVLDEDGKAVPVDTGFMVFNHVTYPNLCRLFTKLKVPTKKTSMSFSVQHKPSGLEYCGSGLNGLFRQRRNLFNLPFMRMLLSIDRFNREAIGIINDERYADWTIEDLMRERKYGDDFLYKYLIPMSGAVWSTPAEDMLCFPAQTLLRFFYNHGFLGLNNQHQWYTVVDGSDSYKNLLIAPFKDRIRLKQKIKTIRRQGKNAVIVHADGHEECFDRVIFACHADEALALLEQPSDMQRELLGAFRYEENQVLLHSDERVMPKITDVWSAWNYRIEDNNKASIIYWMNALQGCSDQRQYFISLNDPGLVDPKLVHRQLVYHHPLFDQKAIAAQKRLGLLNKVEEPLSFCGSYFRYGFHEDAFASSVELAQTLLGRDPW